MASRKQLEANRANSRRSTGPRSVAGKARSRMNSRKHGLTASTLVIAGEDPSEFEKLRAELMEEHGPQTALECELVERLSGLLWRLRRVPYFEAAIMNARQVEVEERESLDRLIAVRRGEVSEEMSDEEWSVRVGRALITDGEYNDALGKLARHETTLMNAFTKTLQMVLLLQRERSQKRETVIVEAVALPPKESH